MSKITKITAFFLFFVMCFCVKNVSAALALETCSTKGAKQTKYTASGCTYTEQTRECCGNGSWGIWGGTCPEYTWICREMPASYCADADLMASVSGSIQGRECSSYGKIGFSSGGNKLADLASSACYQCGCGVKPTSPTCDCSSSGNIRSCNAMINGVAYMGQKKCIGGCMWGDCVASTHLEGEWCDYSGPSTYPCTPASNTSNGGYQSCRYTYTSSGNYDYQWTQCNACGANRCLARTGGSEFGYSYSCVSKPSTGQDAKGKYNCNAATCGSGMGFRSNPWDCTSKTYTSCFDGYTLVSGSCRSDSDGGGDTLRPVDPFLPAIKQ